MKGLPHYRVGYFRELNARLGDSRLSVLVAPYGGPGTSGRDATEELTAAGVRVIRGKGWNIWSPRFHIYFHWASVSRALRKGADIMVLPGAPNLPTNFLALPLARLRGKKVVLWGKGLGTEPRRSLSRIGEKILVRWADAVITYGETSAEYFAKHHPGTPVFIQQNTVDTEALASRAGELRERGERLLSGTRGPRIAFLGRLIPKKRVDQLMAATARLEEGTLLVMGQGPEEPRLRRQACDMGLGDRVRFFGFLDDPYPLIAASDLFVQPGAPGLAVLEAMALATPCVVPDNPLPETELIGDRSTGYRFRQDDVADLARVMRGALEAEDRQAVGKRGQAAVLEKATLKKMVDGFMEMLSWIQKE